MRQRCGSLQDGVISREEAGDGSGGSNVSLSIKTTYYNIRTIILMMKEEDRISNGSKAIGKYQIRPRLDSDVAEVHQIDDHVYYFHYCQGIKGKQKREYNKGYFAVIHDIPSGNLTIFFKISHKLTNLLAQDKKIITNPSFNFTKLRQFDNKLVFDYQVANQDLCNLQVRFQTAQIANKWKQFIYACKPETGQSSKNKKNIVEGAKQTKDKMLSTKDTKNSRHEDVEPTRVGNSRVITSKKSKGKCQYCGRGDDSTIFQANKRELQDLREAERSTKEVYLKESQEHKNGPGAHESLRERELLQKIQRLQAELRQSEIKLKQLTSKQGQFSLSSQQMCRSNQRLKQIVTILTNRNEQSAQQLKNIQMAFKQNQNKLQATNRQHQKLKKCLQQSNRSAQQVNKRVQQADKIVEQANKIAEKYRIELDKISKINESLISTNESLNKSIKDSELKSSNSQELTNRIQQLQRVTLENKDIQKSLKQSYEIRLQQLTKKYEWALQQSKQAKASQEQKTKQMKSLIFNSAFYGELLQNFGGYKQFLLTEIESYMNRSILKTKLIYRFDPYNKVNFHNYIDNCSNLVVIVRTSCGYYLAGFTEDAFYPKVSANDTGLIVSLTNAMTFRCQQGKKAITYDEYYIIFGNSQLRIKSQQNRIFSNFGIANGFYNCNGLKVDAIFGENNREVDLDAYEVYQVHFE